MFSFLRRSKTRESYPRLTKVLDRRFGAGEGKSVLLRHRVGDDHATRQISLALSRRKSGQDVAITGRTAGSYRRLGGT